MWYFNNPCSFVSRSARFSHTRSTSFCLVWLSQRSQDTCGKTSRYCSRALLLKWSAIRESNILQKYRVPAADAGKRLLKSVDLDRLPDKYPLRPLDYGRIHKCGRETAAGMPRTGAEVPIWTHHCPRQRDRRSQCLLSGLAVWEKEERPVPALMPPESGQRTTIR